VHRAVVAAFEAGFFEYGVDFERLPFVAEEIIDSTTESWYEVPGYGDYLSVEGTVADGTYYPICVTGRLPTVEPFTELSNQAPCVLDEERQRTVERMARAAVDALGLETCSTHTEIKLTADRGLCLIESAARLPGAMVPREVEEAWGVDMVGLLVDVLLGDTSRVPKDMLVHGAPRAAATLAFMATDSRGEPWKTLPVFHPDRIEWGNLVSAGTTVEIVEGATIPPGTQVPPYDVAGGILNFGGLFFLVSRDAETLLRDSYSILDNLEAELQRTQSVAEPAEAPGR
jgi:biotin carboxylase